MKQVILVLVGHFALATNVSADSADELIEMAGVKGGLVVQIGCGDESLAAELRANSSYVVHALDVGAAKTARARKTIRSRGVYGPVSVHLFDGVHLPYAENLVNLVVVDTRCEMQDVGSEILRFLDH